MAEARAPQLVKIVMPDGTIRPWDMANEPKPDSVGNQSRNGFLFNCYTHPMGRFFQNTVKQGILAIIRRLHDKDIPRYDKQAYVYEDPRLKKLDEIITNAVADTIDDKDRERKREILLNCKDICLFMLKEDIFYRPRILQAIVAASKVIVANEELLSSLSEVEAYNLTRFTNGIDHAGDFSDLPEDERAKLPKKWTGLP
jgi:hypothetical protein